MLVSLVSVGIVPSGVLSRVILHSSKAWNEQLSLSPMVSVLFRSILKIVVLFHTNALLCSIGFSDSVIVFNQFLSV